MSAEELIQNDTTDSMEKVKLQLHTTREVVKLDLLVRECLLNACLPVMRILHPNMDLVFAFDNSTV